MEYARRPQVGEVFDVWWKVVEIYKVGKEGDNFGVVFKNTANGQVLRIGQNTYRKLKKGETTISKIISAKINPRKVQKYAFFAEK